MDSQMPKVGGVGEPRLGSGGARRPERHRSDDLPVVLGHENAGRRALARHVTERCLAGRGDDNFGQLPGVGLDEGGDEEFSDDDDDEFDEDDEELEDEEDEDADDDDLIDLDDEYDDFEERDESGTPGRFDD